MAAVLAKEPELAKGALLELANNAVTAEHFAQVDEAAADDLGLAWRSRPPAPRGGSTTRTRWSGCSSATPTPTRRSAP